MALIFKKKPAAEHIKMQPSDHISQNFIPSFNQMAWYASSDMLVSIAVGVGLGWLMELWIFAVHPYGLIIGFIFGAIAGFRNIFKMLRKFGYDPNIMMKKLK